MSSLKVSVICPVFNAEKYLSACLDSVFAQSLKEIEIICINDGSTDKSLLILQNYAAKDSRLKIINQTNSGAANCRNTGIELAQGKYLHFCDADDLLQPDMLESMYDSAISEECDIVICNAFYLRNNHLKHMDFALQKREIPQKLFSPKQIPESIFNITNPAAWNKLFKKEFIIKENIRFQNLSSCNDIAFTWLALAAAAKITYSDKGGYIYRCGSDNIISRFRGRTSGNILKAAEHIKYKLICHNLFETMQHSFYEALIDCLHYELRNCNLSQAKDLWFKIRFFMPEKYARYLEDKDRLIFKVLGFKIKIKRTLYEKIIPPLCSIVKDGETVKLRFLGITIKFKCFMSDYRHFIKHSVAPRTVLIIETNKFHGELLPGIAHYFKNLGFNIEFLLEQKLLEEEALATIPFNYRVFALNKKFLNKLKKCRKLKKYSCIYINSHYDYKRQKLVRDMLQTFSQNRVVEMCHDMNHISEDRIKMQNFFTLAEYLPGLTLNTHYFGSIPFKKDKNDIVNFTLIGNIESKRKNFNLLSGAVQKLLTAGYKNFKIVVIGSGDFFNYLNPEIKNFFEVRGRLSYPEMYRAAAEADFNLALLDPENSDHMRYITRATSGNFQLVYGFATPCVIEETFAARHGLNSSNSLVYHGNENLSSAMIEAIKMTTDEYAAKKSQLRKLTGRLAALSQQNLFLFLTGGKTDIELNTFVSLGINCFPRKVLTRNGLKCTKAMGELSLPFDLCVCPVKTIIALIKSDFTDYFKGLKYSFKDKIWKNKRLGIRYNHDQDCHWYQKNKIIKRYRERIDNFRELMGQENPLCFVMTIIKSDIDVEILNLIYDEISRIRKGKLYKLIVVNIDGNYEFDSTGINPAISYTVIPHPYPQYWNYWWKKEHYQSEAGQKFENDVCQWVNEVWRQYKIDNFSSSVLNQEKKRTNNMPETAA